jgi:hypothetical protein
VSQTLSDKYKTPGILLLLTAGALLVHGYHPWSEDAEIYLPGVERILHPQLFPVGREFFQSHASLTFFPNLVAFSLRVTHLPFDVGILLWHAASIFLLLLACWQLSGLLFLPELSSRRSARWCGVFLVAALLTIPVAGTALYVMDQYLNPRNLAAFSGIFAVTRTLERRFLRALLWLAFAACVHPLMWVFPFSFCALWLVMERFESRKKTAIVSAIATFWPAIPLAPVSSPVYHEVAKLHGYFYIQRWAWYEIVGAIAPIGLFWWFAKLARNREWKVLERVCRGFSIYGVIYLVISLVLDLPARFEALARLQTLRSLHLLYIVLFLVIGGLLGEYVLRDKVWRWLLLFVPLSVGMFIAQRALFPESAHVELPFAAPRNPWAQAFVWIQKNTPVDAVFAIDPEYMRIAGEDEIGFRCLAQRSRLADWVKDNGAASMFPKLADEWWNQVQAQTPWKRFRAEDFSRLKKTYGVNWVVVQQPGVAGLDCAFENSVVRVCRIP